MAYKGKISKNRNGNNGAGAIPTCKICHKNGHVASDCRSNKNNGKSGGQHQQHCNNCGPNNTHSTRDYKKDRNNNGKGNNIANPSFTLTKVPSRPCSHCQGPHYDDQCPNINGGNLPQTEGSRRGTPIWSQQNLTSNQPCPICGQAHQVDQCPHRSQPPPNQYVQTESDLIKINQLVFAVRDDPYQAEAIYALWKTAYPEFSQQQQQVLVPQVPQQPVYNNHPAAFTVPPVSGWPITGHTFQFAQDYEETSMTGQQGVYSSYPQQPYANFGAVPHPIDKDGDVIMSEWDYIT